MQVSRHPDVSSGEYPPPLHIIKTSKPRPNQTGSPSRTSTDTDESLASISSSPASDRPLTVVKKRASRNQACSSQELDKSFYSEQQTTIHHSLSSQQLRSFSNDSGTSSEATCPEYELRNANGSSSLNPSIGSARHQEMDTRFSSYHWEQSPDEASIGLTHQQTGSLNGSSRQVSCFFSSAHGSDDAVLDPYLLVPNVSITPEMRTVDGRRSSMWAAIEISGQLFRPSTSGGVYDTPGPNNLFMSVQHDRAGLSRYGCLYDIKVDVLPTAHSSVIDIINDGTSSIIYPGSSILMLAYVQLNASQSSQMGGKRKYEPDDLFADLEFQLGNVETEYIQVRLSYCHSGFPSLANGSTASGVSSTQTRLETTAMGVVKRHSPTSIWSPGPTPSFNALFAIIASHWGHVRAHDIMDRIMTPRPSPRRIVRGNNKSMVNIRQGENTPKTPETAVKAPRAPMRVPRRQASLGKQFMGLEDDGIDPARKIWMKMRRTSSGRDPSSLLHVNKVRCTPARSTDSDLVMSKNTTARVSRSRNEVERCRQQIKETALRNKRSIGADSLRSLVPSLAHFHIDGYGESGDDVTRQKENSHPAMQKNEGRWNFGSWW